jgi:hydrocephalus-inducing protein
LRFFLLKILRVFILFVYSFLTEATEPDTMDAIKCISVMPANGELPSVYDRNSQNQIVQVIVHPKKEIYIKDAPILKCQIIEPSINESSVIANIPIKISIKALLSKYVVETNSVYLKAAIIYITLLLILNLRFNIIPQSEINFGSMLVNSKRQERLVIENKGEFDFKFTINKSDANKNQSK